MQSILFITNHQDTDENGWRRFLDDKFTPHATINPQAAWDFVNFPVKLLIDDVRELQERLSQVGHQPTVFVLTDMAASSLVVQNALLKMLEAPPEAVTFVLVTSTLAPILPTIQSRCQLIKAIITDQNSSELYPSLENLQFVRWPELDASQIAQIITTAFSQNQTQLKKTAPQYSQTSVSLLAFDSYSRQILANLSSKNDISFSLRALKSLTKASQLLRANVSPKNVYYYLALDLQLQQPLG